MTESTQESPRWMIYGANGYTGELVARLAKKNGHAPVLAGRNKQAIDRLGRELGFQTRIFDLASARDSADMLSDMKAVLNCAGPFSATCRAMIGACIASHTHYLDVTGEIDVFEYAHGKDTDWKRAEIVVLPGVGFDVVPTDCLAALLKRALPSATHLKLAINASGFKTSPGTTKTMVEGLPEGGKVRRDGKLVQVPQLYKTMDVPFQSGTLGAVTIPWGDVSTAFYSTGIPNIEAYMTMSEQQMKQLKMMPYFIPFLRLGFVQNFLKGQVGKRVKGPSAAERDANEMQLWGEVTDGQGQGVTMCMRTPEGYKFTAAAALESTLRVAAGDVAAGAHTPATAFGADFASGLEGVQVYDARGESAPAGEPRVAALRS